MGNGLTIKADGVCKGVALSLQNLEVIEEFLPIELGGNDLVLDMKWLESLGHMQVNWQLLTMKFQVGGVIVILQGDPSLGKSLVSLKAMMRTVLHEGEAVLLELQHTITTPQDTSTPLSAAVQSVLHHFDGLFEPPTGLPPSRTRDHAITLQDGASPISVWP